MQNALGTLPQRHRGRKIRARGEGGLGDAFW